KRQLCAAEEEENCSQFKSHQGKSRATHHHARVRCIWPVEQKPWQLRTHFLFWSLPKEMEPEAMADLVAKSFR
ncbi:uncharacterized protein STEHIDRAFT_121236, partial [Stereum hirsutum FP-91666 SS1]|uniref:uncharacterized protein n=1 Tax=Stereum hirsutum (strain FP-91666) TaxID=721885 RepID=UPI0004410309